jgi:hypothetical protein
MPHQQPQLLQQKCNENEIQSIATNKQKIITTNLKSRKCQGLVSKHSHKRQHSTELSKNVKRQRKVEKLPKIFKNITNKGVANFTTKHLNIYEEAVLSLGLKFILKPKNTNDADINKSIDNFNRSVRLNYQFQDTNSMNSCNTKIHTNKDLNICFNVQNQLRVANSSFNPKFASFAIENYLITVKNRFEEKMIQNPLIRNKIPKCIDIALRNLIQLQKTVFIKSADKNLGIVLVTKDWYKTEALKQLNDISTYEKVNTSPTTAWFTSKIKEILNKHNINNPNFAEYTFQFNKSKKQTINCKFYLTIKIHKFPISGRPIAASIGTPTYYLSSYLDKVLQPIIKNK